MDQGAIGWIALAIALLVYVDLVVVELRRAQREAKRIFTRLQGYAELPIFSLLAGAGDDGERIANALERVEPLLERARAALATIRDPRNPRLGAPNSSPDVLPGLD